MLQTSFSKCATILTYPGEGCTLGCLLRCVRYLALTLAAACPLKLGDTVEFGIRPEHISLDHTSAFRVRVNIVDALAGRPFCTH